MADRDELARVLFCDRWEGCGHWEFIARWYGWDDQRKLAYETADAILASGWLARVRADEREACAKVADTVAVALALCDPPGGSGGAQTVAAAIRERNQ